MRQYSVLTTIVWYLLIVYIFDNATTKYEEFLMGKSNKSVRFNEMKVPGLS
jgi:hypothetical protein